MTAGRKMTAARERLGLSIREAAAAAGVSFGALANVEAGRRKATLDWIHAVCVALGIDPHEIDARLASTKERMGGSGKVPRKPKS